MVLSWEEDHRSERPKPSQKGLVNHDNEMLSPLKLRRETSLRSTQPKNKLYARIIWEKFTTICNRCNKQLWCHEWHVFPSTDKRILYYWNHFADYPNQNFVKKWDRSPRAKYYWRLSHQEKINQNHSSYLGLEVYAAPLVGETIV